MPISVFMQNVFDLVNDMREIDKSPDTVIVHKVFKCLPMKYETFVKILQTKKETMSLASLANRLPMEETENGDKR